VRKRTGALGQFFFTCGYKSLGERMTRKQRAVAVHQTTQSLAARTSDELLEKATIDQLERLHDTVIVSVGIYEVDLQDEELADMHDELKKGLESLKGLLKKIEDILNRKKN
jgi:hypothetical protein